MKRVFFISRAGVDQHWAELVARVVRDTGNEAVLQDEHFLPGQSFIDNMTRAAEADCTIAVLSRAYLESEYCLSELNAALAADPLGRRGQLIPILVEPVEMPRLLRHLAYIDLVGADDDTARHHLKSALLKHDRKEGLKVDFVGRDRRAAERTDRNRSAMIEKVRAIWITGFLQQSLFQETRILLGLSERPGAVARPLDLLVKRPDKKECPLPSGTQVVDVFDSMDRTVLILGAPGSGKTTLLLELARDLLARAASNPAHPIPVVFPLSTWATSRKSLVEWLTDELNLRYDVPRKIAAEWVASEQILPLLDGLDEVNAEHRLACVEAINAFRRLHGFLPVAVTSRVEDYEALTEPLRLHGAVLARPLARDQVYAHLTALGPAGESVRAALEQDPLLWELLDTPLLLNIVTVVYARRAEAPTTADGTLTERREHLFQSYSEQMLQRRSAKHHYTRDQVLRWLRWLATQMVRQRQTLFYLERLDASWLPGRQRPLMNVGHAVTEGLFVGLISGITVCIATWTPVFLMLGPSRALHEMAPMASFVLMGTLQLGLHYGMIAAALASATVAAHRFIIRRFIASNQDIQCVENIRWSWASLWRALRVFFAFGIVLGPILAVAWELSSPSKGRVLSWLSEEQALTSLGYLIGIAIGGGLFGPLLALLFGVVLAPVLGASSREVEARTNPNEGIFRSARNAIVFGMLFWLGGILLVALYVGLVLGPSVPGVAVSLWWGNFVGLLFGHVASLRMGGDACIRHVVLRVCLTRNRSTPLNYVKFLDYAADRILLRKVGGGYAFIHRMLLEHFADSPSESLTKARNQADDS